MAAREALTDLLAAFDLKVIDWREASARAGGGTPYTGDIVAAGMELADAVVVLLTPDDIAYVKPEFRMEGDGPHELEPTGQPRLNVIFEAGWAMARDKERVVLVEVSLVRKMSDIAGLNIIQLNNDIDRRKDLAQRLEAAGLTVEMTREEWRTAGDFNRPAPNAAHLEPATKDASKDVSKDTYRDAAPAQVLGQDEAEYRVLRHIEKHFSQLGAHGLNTPFAVPGMTWDQIAATLRDLADGRTAAITGVNVGQLDYPAVITGLTQHGRGRLAAGR